MIVSRDFRDRSRAGSLAAKAGSGPVARLPEETATNPAMPWQVPLRPFPAGSV